MLNISFHSSYGNNCWALFFCPIFGPAWLSGCLRRQLKINWVAFVNVFVRFCYSKYGLERNFVHMSSPRKSSKFSALEVQRESWLQQPLNEEEQLYSSQDTKIPEYSFLLPASFSDATVCNPSEDASRFEWQEEPSEQSLFGLASTDVLEYFQQSPVCIHAIPCSVNI